MSELPQALVAHLLEAYSAYYDISPIDDGTSLTARCDYHSRNSQYVLVKRAEIWAMETHEYLYLHVLPTLDIPTVDAVMARTLAEGEPLVQPHAQHVTTNLSAVILFDSVAEGALAHLKKLKKHKDYKLSLHGWMEFRIAAVDMSTGEIFTNRPGKQLADDLGDLVKKFLHKVKE